MKNKLVTYNNRKYFIVFNEVDAMTIYKVRQENAMISWDCENEIIIKEFTGILDFSYGFNIDKLKDFIKKSIIQYFDNTGSYEEFNSWDGIL